MASIKVSTFLILIVSLLSCGGSSDSSLSGTYSVEDVNILADNIEVGEEVRVEVFFETKTEGDGTPDGVDVVIRVPSELDLVLGSSELYDNSTGDSDRFTPHNIVNCPTGETYIVYNFSDFDLDDHELGGFGKFGLKFQVRGRTPTPQTLVGAVAGSNERFNCGDFLDAEQNEAVEILRRR